MILGIGSDLIDVRRIERVIERHGERFLAAHLHRDRAGESRAARQRGETYAKRFAAKEACAKALGTGLRAGVFWRDMGVAQPALRTAHHEAHRRSAGAAAGDHAGGSRREST